MVFYFFAPRNTQASMIDYCRDVNILILFTPLLNQFDYFVQYHLVVLSFVRHIRNGPATSPAATAEVLHKAPIKSGIHDDARCQEQNEEQENDDAHHHG